MLRRVAALLVGLAVGFVLIVPSAALGQQAPIRVYVDGQQVPFDVPPSMIQGRVLVPLRGIFERLGATVDFDPQSQHIMAVRGPQTVELTIGSRQAHVNSNPILLDVPAFAIAGRTMVPLRFVSESLGANVQWVEASQTILIGSTGASPPPPPPGQVPPSPGQTLSGRLMSVSAGNNPQVVVRDSNGQDHTIAVVPETAIFRYNAQTNAGGSAPLGSLQSGDRVTVDLNGQNQASKITAQYRVAASGQIASVNGGNRTVTLTNGQTFTVLRDARITLNGQGADFGALQNGRRARFLVVEGTNQAYEVNVADTSAQAPAVTVVSAPSIAAPGNGATVGSTFAVQGSAQSGAVVIVRAQPRLLGNTIQQQTVADRAGRWKVDMNVSSIPFVTFPYVISAVEIVNGVQSDAASLEVNVR
jgi:Copper amine oxidase N-terminal domain